jgi:signal transduction histidine kinase
VITRESITVRNTGPALSLAPATLFDRFAKGDPSSTSPGLGLSMVKEIAERNGLRVEYTVADGMHVITVQKG